MTARERAHEILFVVLQRKNDCGDEEFLAANPNVHTWYCNRLTDYLARLDASPVVPATQEPKPEPDPYCSLAASEIPGFGTNRDRHRCAKLHRDKPMKPAAPPGEPTCKTCKGNKKTYAGRGRWVTCQQCAASPEVPRCASWCGSGVTYERTWAGFCSPACRDAGHPLHPAQPGGSR